MIEAYAILDRETGERAGAAGTFQVVKVWHNRPRKGDIVEAMEEDLTYLIEPGRHFHSLAELASFIQSKKYDSVTIIEDVD